METDNTPHAQGAVGSWPTISWVGLGLFVVDRALDSTATAVLVAAASVFALLRWRSAMSLGARMVVIGVLTITILDFVDAGLLPVIRVP